MNIKLFDTLIWYSQIKAILNNLNTKDEFFKNLSKLFEFKEMSFMVQLILAKLFQKDISIDSCFTKKDKEKALFTLNAHMICKLLSIDKSFIDNPQEISEVINSYIKRNPCDKAEILWIQQIASQLKPDFCLLIPEFEPIDLIFLIVNKKSQSDFQNGPFFKQLNNLDFLKEINELKHAKFESFHDVAKSIGQIVYSKMISNENPPQNYEEIVLAFDSQEDAISKRIKSLFGIAQALDKWTEQKLEFDDISFLKNDFLDDQKLMNQFPSLVFWICENQKKASDLISSYKSYKPISNQIPLWLLELRIKSSLNCIKFDGYSQNKTTKTIKNAILKYLTDSMQQNKDINCNWISFLISDPPQKMANSDIKIVHDFLYDLSMGDEIRLPETMNHLKYSFIQEAISEIIFALLSSQGQNLFSSNLGDSGSINNFFISPVKYIQGKFISYSKHLVLSNESIDHLKRLLDSLDSFKESIRKLEKEIENDQEQKNFIIPGKINDGTIFFGNRHIDSKTFIKILESLYYALKSLDDDFLDNIERYLETIKSARSKIDDIINNLSVRFADDSPAPITECVLQGEIKDFLITLNPVIKETMIFLKKVYSIIDFRFIRLFNYHHDIPIVHLNQNSRQLAPDFSTLLLHDSFLLPIIYASPENKIICSFDKLICHILPVFPSLYCNPVVVNIVSMINERISLKMVKFSDSQHEELISIIELQKSGIDLIQLSIRPPQVTKKEPEIVVLKGEINIEAERFKSLILPFEIRLTIIPLKFILRCLEYQIAEENHSFRLCCDKIKSDKKVNLEIIHYFIHDFCVFKAGIELLEGNEAATPGFIISKKCFSFSIPKINSPSRSHFLIKIAFAQNMIIQIHCDFIIMPIQFNESEEIESKMAFIKLPEKNEWYDYFIISENESPKPFNIKDGLGSVVSPEINYEDNYEKQDSSLPNIELPEVLSIRSLNAFYLNCAIGAALLPSFIMKMKIKHLNLHDLELYFAKLLEIYISVTKESIINRSILSINVNSFINSFGKCVSILKRSGVNFSRLSLPYSLNRFVYDLTEFIILPDLFIPDLSGIDEEKEIYIQNFLKSQKILIVMLYDNRANKNENLNISPDKIMNAKDPLSVREAVGFYGIDLVLVQNYKDAVFELTKQTIPGKCDYYATWVISGHPYDIPLVDGGNQYLVDQFIDCLIQFWKNGGSVVMFANGDPFTFQANLFLERIIFPNNVKTNLRIGGVHKGGKFLTGDETGQLNQPGTFYKSPSLFKYLQRSPLSFGIEKIYEGEAISFVHDDKSIYSPFIPFMKDSENGISALIYPSVVNRDYQTGDIIIDCGYSKLFSKMYPSGTFRYVRNIAGWTARPEINKINGIEPWNYRPKAVIFDLNESKKFDLQDQSFNSNK